MAAATVTTSLPQFNGLRTKTYPTSLMCKLSHPGPGWIDPDIRKYQDRGVSQSMVIAQPMRCKGQGALGAHCDFIGSSTNLIMVTTTSLMLFAGRFGLAPSANRKATAGLKLETRDSGLQTGDPAGFTLADTLACGTVGHIIGVGFVLGLKNVGAL